MSKPDSIAAYRLWAGLVHPEELGNGVAQGLRAFVGRAEARPRPSCCAARGNDRVALGMVGIQEASGDVPFDHSGPASIPDSPHPAHRC